METIKNKSKLGWKTWFILWLAGMAGQLAWNIENQWFNTFVYEKIAPNPNIITWMVAISAIVSTGATFLMGTFSDRIGKRRFFILLGYVMWGVSTIVFGLTQFAVGALSVTASAILLIIADAVMSFFGSTGNDCGFNAWTTDITNPSNRGSLGTVIAIQPVIATIGGSVLLGMIINSFSFLKVGEQVLDYFMMFLIIGVLIIIVGIVSFFIMKESPTLIPRRDCSFKESLKKPFNFKTLKNNKLLLYVLLIFMVFFISFNIYFSHILNYFLYGSAKDSIAWLNNTLFGSTTDMKETLAGAIMAVGMLLGIPLVVLSGKILNKKHFIPIIFISVILNAIGLLILFFGGLANIKGLGEIIILVFGIFFVGTGYMGIYQALMVWIKNLYPEEMRSQFEGIRMIFYVCIPMFLGSLLGNIAIQGLGETITISYPKGDISGFAPNYYLFLVAFGLVLLTFIPIIFASREVKKNPPNYIE